MEYRISASQSSVANGVVVFDAYLLKLPHRLEGLKGNIRIFFSEETGKIRFQTNGETTLTLKLKEELIQRLPVSEISKEKFMENLSK